MGGFRSLAPLGCADVDTGNEDKDLPTLHSLTITPMGGLNVDLSYLRQQAGATKPLAVGAQVNTQGGKPTAKFTDVTLGEKPVPGTPVPEGPFSPANLARMALQAPVLSLDPESMRLSGTAELVLEDSNYPKTHVGATKIRLFVQTDAPKLSLGEMPSPGLSGSASLGPAQIDFKVKLKYDAASLAQCGLSKKTLEKLTEPGFDLSGVLQFAVIKNIPVLNKVLRTKFSASSPSIKPLDKPLYDAPTKFALKYNASGMIPVPPGAILKTTSLGFGAMGADWNQSRGYGYTVGVLGLPSIARITSEFDTYLYLDGFFVKRISDGWELSVRMTLAKNRKFGGKEKGSDSEVEQWRALNHKAWLPTSKDNPAPEEEKPVFLGTVSLRYDF